MTLQNQHKFPALLAVAIILIIGAGCGIASRLERSVTNENANVADNKTLEDKAIDVALGEEKIGVKECDEVLDLFKAEANNPDDDFVTKAIKSTVLNKLREQFKKSIEENKTDKEALARSCSDFKVQLEKYKAEESSNKQ